MIIYIHQLAEHGDEGWSTIRRWKKTKAETMADAIAEIIAVEHDIAENITLDSDGTARFWHYPLIAESDVAAYITEAISQRLPLEMRFR